MQSVNNVLNNTEKIIYSLRELYGSYGYTQYRMSKFEEYDLYSRNKDFLVSDSVITFTDTNGKLMALKPDVTLSIIKNTKDNPDSVQKLCYNENVYRVSKGTNSFKEIMQVGLECIGKVDDYAISESLMLAAKSLSCISDDFVLDVSNIDILSAFINDVTPLTEARAELMKCAGEKNVNGISTCCIEFGIPQENADLLKALVGLYGRASAVIPKLSELITGSGASPDVAAASERLRRVISVFDGTELSDKINIDFSVICDVNYYNGIVFKGFINNIPGSVLSGGQYDRLMAKMGKKSSAVGFAVYMDALELLETFDCEYDVDVMLLYGPDSSPSDVNSCVSSFVSEGKSVIACTDRSPKLKYRTLSELRNGEVKILEDNA